MPGEPWHPSPYEDADVYAVQAIAAGVASEAQQKRAFALIVNGFCGTYDLSYRPESQRNTDFAEGKRWVGLQLVKLLKLRPKSKESK